MPPPTPPRMRAVVCSTAALAAVGLLLALGCAAPRDRSRGTGLTADVLDAVEAGMQRLAHHRWPSWSMRVERDALAFEIEVRSDEGNVAHSRDCAAIGDLMRESAGDRPWTADFVHDGQVLGRCSRTTAAAPAPHRPLG